MIICLECGAEKVRLACGKPVCRPCVAAHAAQTRAAKKAGIPVPPKVLLPPWCTVCRSEMAAVRRDGTCGAFRCTGCTEVARKAKAQAYRDANKEKAHAYNAAYRAENRQVLRDKNKVYREENVDRIREVSRQYRTEHREELLEYGRAYRAKPESQARHKAWLDENEDALREWRRTYRDMNRQELAVKLREYRKTPENRERAKLLAQCWRESNPGRRNWYERQRKQRLAQHRPAWAADTLIEEFYKLAKLRGQVTGIEWHVDHIVPLKSDRVCGLHWEGNLQVIPAAANLAKRNDWWPDMPDAPAHLVAFAARPSLYLCASPAAGPVTHGGPLE